MNQTIPAIFGGPPGVWELAIVGVIALLIFGRRLPDVARSVGKRIVEFKRGLKDVKNEIDVQSRMDSTPEPKLEQKPESTSDSIPASESAKESTPASK